MATVTMACDAPELAFLKAGPARFGDLEVEVQRVAPRERHKRMAESQAFDICEFSLVDCLSGAERGLPFTAMPIFPHRIFRHRDIWLSGASGINEPKELSGKRVGIQSWTNSASVWQRGLLAQDYGVNLSSIEWLAESTGHAAKWARLTAKPRDVTLDRMLASGAIDALMLPRPPELPPDEMARIRRLFPDYSAVEQDYRARSGIFPIMHVMVIKNDLLASRPTVAKIVCDGVQATLDKFIEHQRATSAPSIIWPQLNWQQQEKFLGPYPWPAGVDANRKELDMLIGYCAEQGILSRRIAPDELFKAKG